MMLCTEVSSVVFINRRISNKGVLVKILHLSGTKIENVKTEIFDKVNFALKNEKWMPE
jgi:hypothetical protein